MTNHELYTEKAVQAQVLDGDITITIPRSRKVVECSNGAPECETANLKFTVTSPTNAEPVTVVYNPIFMANSLTLKRSSGPSTTKKSNVGPISCALCNDSKLSTDRTKIMDQRLGPALRDMTDEAFLKKTGRTKEDFLQFDMDNACEEYMNGNEQGLVLFYQKANFNTNCNKPLVLRTGYLKATIVASMKVYWFSSNCVRSEETFTATRSFNITSKQFSLPTLKGGVVAFRGHDGQGTRYGYTYDCPKYTADLFCGVCYYEFEAGNMFKQPRCFDVSGNNTLGSLAQRANTTKLDKNGQPFNPFLPAKEIRDAIAEEIKAKTPALINEAIQELIAKALEISAQRSIGGRPVCRVGYELDSNIDISYSIRSPG